MFLCLSQRKSNWSTPCESHKYLPVPLPARRRHPLLAIRPMGHGKRAALRSAGASTLRKPDQRLLRAGCARRIGSALGVYACRRTAAPHATPLASDYRSLRSGSQPGPAAISLSSRARPGRIQSHRLTRRRSGVVTPAGQDGHPFALYPDFDGMILRAAVRSARRVGQRVLVASFFRNLGVQFLHRPALQSLVAVAARFVSLFGKPFESAVEERAAHPPTTKTAGVST